MQTLKGGRAFWAGVFGFGYVYVGRIGIALALVGYVYVGRIGIALALVGVTVALIAIFGWTRWILDPVGIYILAGLLLALLILEIAHPVTIAVKRPGTPRKRYNRWWFYVIWFAVGNITLNLIFGSRAALFGYETFRIPSRSMAPTLEEQDFIIVDSWLYRKVTPVPGDVIVYEVPDSPGVQYVKRVVATPGDLVEIREGRLYRNGAPAAEEYLDASLREGGADFGPFALSSDEYFVLGDNRNNSRDSRFHGPVFASQISGRVESIWFPFARLGEF